MGSPVLCLIIFKSNIAPTVIKLLNHILNTVYTVDASNSRNHNGPCVGSFCPLRSTRHNPQVIFMRRVKDCARATNPLANQCSSVCRFLACHIRLLQLVAILKFDPRQRRGRRGYSTPGMGWEEEERHQRLYFKYNSSYNH